jgi:hypothetical protein
MGVWYKESQTSTVYPLEPITSYPEKDPVMHRCNTTLSRMGRADCGEVLLVPRVALANRLHFGHSPLLRPRGIPSCCSLKVFQS